MKVTVVVACLNERDSVVDFCMGMMFQTRPPDHIHVIDGGSTDGTPRVLEIWRDTLLPQMLIVSDPHYSLRHSSGPVGKARNYGILNAPDGIIAVTDMGCRYPDHWLAALVRPIEDGLADVVSGESVLDPQASALQQATARSWFHTDYRNPSSRSVAFTKAIWRRAGGYPEDWLTGDDTGFNARLRRVGARFVPAPDAFVWWLQPATLRGQMRQMFRYAKGDALMHHNDRAYRRKFLTVLAAPVFKGTRGLLDIAKVAGWTAGKVKGKW